MTPYEKLSYIAVFTIQSSTYGLLHTKQLIILMPYALLVKPGTRESKHASEHMLLNLLTQAF